MCNYNLIALYSDARDLFLDKNSVFPLSTLQYFLGSSDQKFLQLCNEVDKRTPIDYCDMKIQELMADSINKELIVKSILKNIKIRKLILYSFHDDNIFEINKEVQDLIVHTIDNAETQECIITFKKHEIINNNLNLKLDNIKILSDVQKNYISGTQFHIYENHLYYLFYLFDNHINDKINVSIIKFEDLDFIVKEI